MQVTPLPLVALSAAQPVLQTARLRLVGDDPHLGPAVADYVVRNRAHFAPWDPPAPPEFFSADGQAERVLQGVAAFARGEAFRYWLLPADAPERVIGSLHFSQMARGAFQNAMLGYALDQAAQGQGLMHEALQAGLAEMFSPRVNLHRIQAAWQPSNLRSGAVLQRLGFVQEGLCRDYLFINGAWRDHCISALLNPAFQKPPGWSA
ncbi:GNAT family N-acetyltransferase [Ideonella paludis]|uniref:GNAT family N-acetyltransferase n=1 Tax=Ideonella paludis TaxID=1233411 RepID=A0ABS5DYE7_9BURK|nr:GNAT family N-acetyltransferase [Ideonella paludis]MBQ0936172.1 GNAT family N-acetyltransferase [Ideonella paludis]